MGKLSLKDVAPRLVTVTVENKQIGQVWEVEMALPTLAEWNEAQFGVEFPSVPYRDMWDEKVNGKVKKPDFNDPEYLRARDLAFEQINMRRVTKALLGAGNFPELANLPLAKATDDLIKASDRDFLRGVHMALMEIISGTKGGVEAKRAAFPDLTLSETSGVSLPEQEHHAEPVA